MCLDDNDASEDIDCFPVSEEDRDCVVFLMRGLLKEIPPASIRDAAILLLALERLPDPTLVSICRVRSSGFWVQKTRAVFGQLTSSRS